MPVRQVTERLPLERDKVYVIPPDRQLVISEDDICATEFAERRGQRAPIDSFFQSLAAHHGDGLAIVMSGGGSDGAAGVRSIKEQGGLILVQDPTEAEFASMPRSAIASGADFVLPVKEIAAQLLRLLRVRERLDLQTGRSDHDDLLKRIIGVVRAKTGQDFAQYKRATLLRRVARRMQVNRTETLGDYLGLLRDHADEAKALFDDLLISVTGFFRDPAAFRVLATSIIPKLFAHEQQPQGIRVWVPGCATGEEAYSIAILLLEEAARQHRDVDIQVFATDLDEKCATTWCLRCTA